MDLLSKKQLGGIADAIDTTNVINILDSLNGYYRY
jgi:hypothetical protein